MISLSESTGAIFPLSQFLIVIALRAGLPFPSQLKAPEFNNTDVTRFVEKWDNIYENCGIKVIKKTCRVPKYITKIIKEYIRAQEEYEKRD
jgi:hypothetical protein